MTQQQCHRKQQKLRDKRTNQNTGLEEVQDYSRKMIFFLFQFFDMCLSYLPCHLKSLTAVSLQTYLVTNLTGVLTEKLQRIYLNVNQQLLKALRGKLVYFKIYKHLVLPTSRTCFIKVKSFVAVTVNVLQSFIHLHAFEQLQMIFNYCYLIYLSLVTEKVHRQLREVRKWWPWSLFAM